MLLQISSALGVLRIPRVQQLLELFGVSLAELTHQRWG